MWRPSPPEDDLFLHPHTHHLTQTEIYLKKPPPHLTKLHRDEMPFSKALVANWQGRTAGPVRVNPPAPGTGPAQSTLAHQDPKLPRPPGEGAD